MPGTKDCSSDMRPDRDAGNAFLRECGGLRSGPIDPQVSVLYAESFERKPIFTYVNFAVHLDIIGFEEISADMTHYLSEILGRVKDPDMVTIFSQGCSGDVDHNAYGQEPKTGPATAEQIAYRMAGAVLLALFYWIIDVRGHRRWAFPFIVVGMNSITIYMVQALFDFGIITGIFVHGFTGYLGSFEPVFLAICLVAVKWLFLYFLYVQKIFLKV